MSALFDPYHKWLGIAPKDQPPHHYRLLGLENFEEDLQVIEAAADRQQGFLRRYQSGEHAAECQKLLNEVSRARLCLLKGASKAAYDAELRARLEGGNEFADVEFTAETSGDVVSETGIRQNLRSQSGQASFGALGLVVPSVIGGVLAVSLVAGVMYFRGGPTQPPANSPAGQTPVKIAQATREKSERPRQAQEDPAPFEPVAEPESAPLPSDGSDDVKAKFFGGSRRQRTSSQNEAKSPGGKLVDVTPSPRQKQADSDLKAGETVDLLPLVDLQRDVGSGTVTREGSSLKTGNNGYCQFSIPIKVPQEYSLLVELETTLKAQAACVIFPMQAGLATSMWGNNKGDTNILAVDGVTFINYRLPEYPRDRFVERPVITSGRTKLQYVVRRNHLQVSCNGELLYNWRGDTRRFVPVPEWPSPIKRLALGSHGTVYKFHSVKLTQLSNSKSPFKPARPPANGDLLAIVDPERDTTSGFWTQAGSVLTSTPELPNAIRFPAQLPADFEFRTVVERQNSGEILEISLPVQGAPVVLAIDGYRGTGGGIELIDGKRYDHNPHFLKYESYKLPQGETATIQGQVQGRHLTVEINGKPYLDLDVPEAKAGPPEVRRPTWLTYDESLQLALSTDSIFKVYEVRFRALSDDSQKFPKLDVAKLKGASQSPAGKSKPERAAVKTALMPVAVPVPEASARQAATSKVRELFAEDFSKAKKDSEKSALAAKLETMANDSSADPAERYACLDLARDFAAEAGDVERAFALTDKLSSEFEVKGLELKTALMRTLAPKVKGPLLNKELVGKVLPLIDSLMESDQFAQAIEMSTLAGTMAVKAKEKAIQADAGELKKAAEELGKQFAVADAARKTLASSPDDPAAKVAWGRWLCLRKHNWEEGLPLLAGSSHVQLKGLAERDLKAPASKTPMIELGNDWLTFAKSEKDHSEALFADRAMFWFQRALETSAGLEKNRTEQLLAKALEVRDWNSPLVGLLDQVEKKVQQGRYTKATYTFSVHGDPFEMLMDPPGVLVGMNYALWSKGSGEGSGIIKAIQPVYFTKLGLRSDVWRGDPQGAQQLIEVRARPGYAINGLACQIRSGVLQLTFARVTRNGLDAGRTYQSTSTGVQVQNAETPFLVMSGTQPIIGLLGHADSWLNGIGAIFTK